MQATRCGMLKIKNKNKSKFQGVACSNKKKLDHRYAGNKVWHVKNENKSVLKNIYIFETYLFTKNMI
jgi:hypothetical protein